MLQIHDVQYLHHFWDFLLAANFWLQREKEPKLCKHFLQTNPEQKFTNPLPREATQILPIYIMLRECMTYDK